MKLATAFVLVAGIALPCAAADFAIDKGSWLVGGTAGFEMWGGDLYEVEDEKATLIELVPRVGYFLMPGLAVGGTLEFMSLSQGETDLSVLGVGPMVEYYFGGPYSKMYPFLSARFNWSKTSNDDEFTDTTFGFSAGGIMMLCRNVGLRAAAFYAMDSTEPEDGDSTDGNRMGLRVGFESFIW